MTAPRQLVSTLPRHINHDALLCAIIDELQGRPTRPMTPDEQSWLRYLAEETGDPQIGRLIFNTRELEPGEILSVARQRSRGKAAPGFLSWILSPHPDRSGRGRGSPSNVVFRLRMLLKRDDDAPEMSADVDDVMNWIASSELSHDDLDYLENDARTWRAIR